MELLKKRSLYRTSHWIGDDSYFVRESLNAIPSCVIHHLFFSRNLRALKRARDDNDFLPSSILSSINILNNRCSWLRIDFWEISYSAEKSWLLLFFIHFQINIQMILGGTEVTEEGIWPWQVSLQKYNETEDRWKWAGCGGISKILIDKLKKKIRNIDWWSLGGYRCSLLQVRLFNVFMFCKKRWRGLFFQKGIDCG